ncbi:hypothetical protein [Actinomadura chokoriensis]|uniref:Uncharacterized protein n=1 Tax=Actinomadura chokoriensis TaxID=454156 RepID=A0ABV4QW00_9ACTN
MTTPEENVPRTDDTDHVRKEPGGDPEPEPDRRRPDERSDLGAELEAKMAEKGLSREDFSGS